MAVRGVESRLAYMLAHPPGRAGMCARTCWLALGGSNGTVPAWGAASANEVYDKVIRSGRYFRGDPPRGALVIWKYGRYGHTALALSRTRIRTTDPSGRPGGVGDESISYPHKWGANSRDRIWTDQYNGVRFPVGEEAPVAAWLKYSGKPSGVLRVPIGRYVTVDVQIPGPPKGGVKEDRMVYLNVKPTWKLPKTDPLYWFQTANIRVRWQRATHNGKPANNTAYGDYTITPWEDEFLLTHLHWETSEKGRGGKWHLKIKGHVKDAVVQTRYSKGAL